LNYQNNYVERSNQLLEYRSFSQHCSLFLIQQNYFLIYTQQNFKFLSKVILSVYEYRTIWKHLKVNYLLLSFENRLDRTKCELLARLRQGRDTCRDAVTNIRLATHVIGDAENRGMPCIIAQPTASC